MSVAGLFGILVSALADVMGIGHSGFGLDQLVGMILGTFAFLAGLVRLYATDKARFGRLLTCIYIIGLLTMGLMPHPGRGNQVEIFWDAKRFFSRDFFINSVGFVMVGYLLMLSLESRQVERDVRYWVKKAAIVVLGGSMLSLALELSQYFLIPGREPSTADLLANVLGTSTGVFLYVLGSPLHENRP
jgi:glycopeptide antibiotics resistance protein